MTSAARKERRKGHLELRRQAKRRGLTIGSKRHLTWLLLVSNGRTYDEAITVLDGWDAEGQS